MTFKYKISSKPTVEFHLDLEVIDMLIDLAKHHYDGACQGAAGEEGFLLNWRKCVVNSIEYQSTWPPVRAEFRQIDTCLKVMEMGSYSSDPEVNRLCGQTTFRFMKLCHELNCSFDRSLSEGEIA